MSLKIAIIGGGHMGRALASGIAKCTDLDAEIIVADPLANQLTGYEQGNVRTTSNNDEAISQSAVVILAVKPQVVKPVIVEHANELQTKLVISIAAGVPMTNLEAWLKPSTPIIHCMPNLPASIGEGITAIIANSFVSSDQKNLSDRIFNAVGDTVWIKDDWHIDIVTAVSGSGPAYFFYLMDAMIQAAIELGMDAKVAKSLATKTALGAACLAADSPKEPATLRSEVASPGGTTERALAALDANSVRESVIDAVKAAFTRSTELTASL